MHKREDQSFTPEQIGQHVRQAVKLADNAQLSDADRAVLLPEILKLVSLKQVFYEQAAQLPDLSKLGVKLAR